MFTCTSLFFASFINVPSFICVDLGPLLLEFSIHPYVGRWFWLDAVDDKLAFVAADFHAVFQFPCITRTFLGILLPFVEVFRDIFFISLRRCVYIFVRL